MPQPHTGPHRSRPAPHHPGFTMQASPTPTTTSSGVWGRPRDSLFSVSNSADGLPPSLRSIGMTDASLPPLGDTLRLETLNGDTGGLTSSPRPAPAAASVNSARDMPVSAMTSSLQSSFGAVGSSSKWGVGGGRPSHNAATAAASALTQLAASPANPAATGDSYRVDSLHLGSWGGGGMAGGAPPLPPQPMAGGGGGVSLDHLLGGADEHSLVSGSVAHSLPPGTRQFPPTAPPFTLPQAGGVISGSGALNPAYAPAPAPGVGFAALPPQGSYPPHQGYAPPPSATTQSSTASHRSEEDDYEPRGGRGQGRAAANKARHSSSAGGRSLPAQATAELRAWMLAPANFDHPWPTEGQKQELADKCGISVRQVTVWLTNARKRIWKPLREQKGLPVTDYKAAKHARRQEELERMASQAAGESAAAAVAATQQGAGGNANATRGTKRTRGPAEEEAPTYTAQELEGIVRSLTGTLNSLVSSAQVSMDGLRSLHGALAEIHSRSSAPHVQSMLQGLISQVEGVAVGAQATLAAGDAKRSRVV